MKKLFFVLFSCFIFSITANAKEVVIEKPTFDIKINYIDIDESAMVNPLIMYNNVTYIPLGSFRFVLGLDYINDEKLLSVSKKADPYSECVQIGWNRRDLYTRSTYIVGGHAVLNPYLKYADTLPDISGTTAEVLNKTFEVQGELVESNEYPVLYYADKIYIPMTWEYAVQKLGLTLRFSADNGLEIYGDSWFRVYEDVPNGGASGDYIIKDDLCIYVKMANIIAGRSPWYPKNNLYIANDFGPLEQLPLEDESISFGYNFALREGGSADCYEPQIELDFDNSTITMNAMQPATYGETWRVKVDYKNKTIKKWPFGEPEPS